MWWKVLLLAWVSLHVQAYGLLLSAGDVGCDRNSIELECRYDDVSEVVSLARPVDTSIKKVTIHNTKKLHISGSLCVNISLYNVSEVVVFRDGEDACKEDLELFAKDSFLQAIPRQVKRLDVQDSTIASITSTINVTSLLVTHSVVGVLNIEAPLADGSSVAIRHSSVSKFQRLELQYGSKLHIQETNVSELLPRGLVVSGGSAIVENSAFKTTSRESVVLSLGGEISLRNNTGNIQVVNVVDDAYRGQILCVTCGDISYYSYFGEFIAVSVLLALLSAISLALTCRLCQKRRKSRAITEEISIADGSEKNETNQPLLEVNNSKENVEILLKETVASVNEETSRHTQILTELKCNYESGLHETQEQTKAKEQRLDSDMKSELKAIEHQYSKELREPTMFNWDKIKEVLLKTNEATVEHIVEKYKERKYDIQNHCDVHKLHYNVALLRENKQYLIKLSEVGRTALIRWNKIRNLSSEIGDDASAQDRLFNLLESLLINLKCDLEQSYEREILEKDKKYGEDTRAQQEKLSRKIEKIDSEFEEECRKIEQSRAEEMEYTSLWNTQYVRGKIEMLYSVRLQTAKVLHSVAQKKAQDKHSDVSLKLHHLEVLIRLQNRHITNMEKLLTMIIDTITIHRQVSTRRMSGQSFEDEIKLQDFREARNDPEVFLRFVSETIDEIDRGEKQAAFKPEPDLKLYNLPMPLKVSPVSDQFQESLSSANRPESAGAQIEKSESHCQVPECTTENRIEDHMQASLADKIKIAEERNDTGENPCEDEAMTQSTRPDVSGSKKESMTKLQGIETHSDVPAGEVAEKPDVTLYIEAESSKTK
ncbi:probable DNA double-strand break repair Rad50 ATPase [Penaeus vannamei]|uniref:probable DNA double-strand break repair Rad50 ATPase n=1 Tax=Penaeus vannamei TaxID=6689 RepID=UPI00387F4123